MPSNFNLAVKKYLENLSDQTVIDALVAVLGGVRTYEVFVTAASRAVGGPLVLYTPVAGERIVNLIMVGFVFTDVDVGIWIGDTARFSEPFNTVDNAGLGFLDRDLCFDSTRPSSDAGAQVESGSTTEPLTAYWVGSNGKLVDSAPAARQANHAYAGGEWIIKPNSANANVSSLYHLTTPGTSGAGEPTWDYGPVTDGTAEWTYEGIVPAAGQALVTFSVVTPVAP